VLGGAPEFTEELPLSALLALVPGDTCTVAYTHIALGSTSILCVKLGVLDPNAAATSSTEWVHKTPG
jgi:hypothetical protein